MSEMHSGRPADFLHMVFAERSATLFHQMSLSYKLLGNSFMGLPHVCTSVHNEETSLAGTLARLPFFHTD